MRYPRQALRKFSDTAEQLQDPPAISTNTTSVVAVGLVIWFIMGIVAVIFADQLADAGRGWMIATPPLALCLGAWGYWYARRHPN